MIFEANKRYRYKTSRAEATFTVYDFNGSFIFIKDIIVINDGTSDENPFGILPSWHTGGWGQFQLGSPVSLNTSLDGVGNFI